MKNVRWSTPWVAMPLQAASWRFCMTARMRRPCGRRVMYNQIPVTAAATRTMMNTRA